MELLQIEHTKEITTLKEEHQQKISQMESTLVAEIQDRNLKNRLQDRKIDEQDQKINEQDRKFAMLMDHFQNFSSQLSGSSREEEEIKMEVSSNASIPQGSDHNQAHQVADVKMNVAPREYIIQDGVSDSVPTFSDDSTYRKSLSHSHC